MSYAIHFKGTRDEVVNSMDEQARPHLAQGRLTEAQHFAIVSLMESVGGSHVAGVIALGEGENFGSIKVEITGYNE